MKRYTAQQIGELIFPFIPSPTEPRVSRPIIRDRLRAATGIVLSPDQITRGLGWLRETFPADPLVSWKGIGFTWLPLPVRVYSRGRFISAATTARRADRGTMRPYFTQLMPQLIPWWDRQMARIQEDLEIAGDVFPDQPSGNGQSPDR